jgi:hypothetical protein
MWKSCGKAVDRPVDEMWKTLRLSQPVDKLPVHPQVLHSPSTTRQPASSGETRLIHSFHSTDYYDDIYIYREFISNSAVNNRASAR